MLISVEELDRMMNVSGKSTLIIDTRSWHDYISGHIPTAINFDVFAFHWMDTSEHGINRFNEHLTTLLRSIGVTYDKSIVVYDDISGTLAARGLWLLHYISHDGSYMLDGGLYAWRSKGYSLEYRANRAEPLHGYSYRFDSSVIADYRYILSRLDDDVTIIDARSEYEYKGVYVRAARGGHIPKAINIDWESNITRDGRFKSIEELKSIYRLRSKEVICYCQGGYRAAHTYVALRLLGFNAKVYLGSWYEWGNRYELPIES
jgi:thiosulfate/3-mercaptopyruvate sulfurtransferase